ncbi:hypothetical protein [Sphingomonas aerolata]|uniref:hypothetical protein n=1 Tax=Sphingomonas aerolata TaxID=185951 RepID=UPI003A5C3929
MLHGLEGQARHAHLHRRQEEIRRLQAVRGRHRQPQPPPAPDRERVDARGAEQIPVRRPVRGLRRRAPEARGACGQDRDEGHQLRDPPLGRRRAPVLHRHAAASRRPAERDRRTHPEGNRRTPRLPQQCRARLSQPRSHLGHAQRRREPAHPPRVADRQRAVGRALRPR